ncbi:MAG: AMP-binding protein [Burkholderiales bacterium]|nr:AMP-binding protein [Burkholderiales bacterium]
MIEATALVGTAPATGMALTAATNWLDRPAIEGERRTWTWREIHLASLALAARLGDATAVCNLCASRLGFLVTALAALRRGALLILPPSGGNAEMGAVIAGDRGTFVVGDPQAWPEPWCGDRYLQCLPDLGCSAADDAHLAWQPRWDKVAVRLYTSGSTGVPQPQPKTLGQLVAGARALSARLAREIAGGVAALERIVCSVPPQHMFGLECSVMLSLVAGTPVLDRRPLLPADVRAAFDDRRPAAWIATPMHLRNLAHADGEAAPGCRVTIVSTMPLSPEVAVLAERRLGAPVLEIYGSTETGALAMRRTAAEAAWRPLPGVRLEAGADGTTASGAHFASPVAVPDRIAPSPDGTFALLGRQADLVKIAGRRASLAGLDRLLLDLPGLEDGAFFLPQTGQFTERLCLIYAGPPLDPAATSRWLRERLDPVFLPRTFIRVERLPRTEGGKLRRAALERLYDEWQGVDTSPQLLMAAAPGRHLPS